jgi:hypothetical protein
MVFGIGGKRGEPYRIVRDNVEVCMWCVEFVVATGMPGKRNVPTL